MSNLCIATHVIITVLAVSSLLYNFWIKTATKQKVSVFSYSFI